ncbi:CYTH and CHAD domain-containing protein [Tsukamurella sp. 1534]|uniref:CYTH and CHAD domain-containing protein n=1 Tax=Tsukamurella sp. 1534 TaxID=1151061 RepID=UPI0002F34851|nr:CYTH and CHAD domain-containing protein [Tsukamurella sp. 1534]
MSEQREIETKYEVGADTEVPPLAAVSGVDRTSTDAVFHLTAVYYDTEALDLSANRITLRRRTGGKDDGWHLKLPDGADRREVTAELGDDDTVPAELAERVRAIVRGRELAPIAIVENQRHTTYLHAVDGELLGEFVDDHVHSISLLPDGVEKAWREWEFEVPDTALGRKAAILVDKALRAAGGGQPDAASKLARAIDSEPARNAPPLPKKASHATAGQLLVAALSAYRDKMVREDPRVRARGADSVHQMRVATRQLRSVLTEFSGFFSGPSRAALSSELKLLASVLGGVRDAEVLAARFEDFDAEGELGGAAAALAERQRAAEARGWGRVTAALDSDRYFLLLDAIDAFIADPPLRDRADQPAVKSLAPLLDKRIRSFGKQSSALLSDAACTDDDVHAIRKHAKRLRYASAVVDPVVRGDLKAEVKALSRVQTRLGEFQDATIARDAIAGLAAETTDPVVAFRLGRLDAIEERRAADARETLPRLLHALR